MNSATTKNAVVDHIGYLESLRGSFDEVGYADKALNNLLMLAVYRLSQMKQEITTEDIVAACFLLFPARFCLRGYPQWPDSTVVNKRWIDCRDKGFLSGSTATGFSLTPKGLAVAEKTLNQLNPSSPLSKEQTPIKGEMRTRAGRFVRSIETSDAYKFFTAGKSDQVSEFDFRSMLLCTMESSSQTLSKNLEQFKQYAGLYKRDDIVSFLELMERRFCNLLSAGKGQQTQFRGGMLKRRMK